MVLLRECTVFFSESSLLHLHRKESVVTERFDDSSVAVAINNSNLYNAMIYPFTRMVIYGVIWYQGKLLCFDVSYSNH